MSPMVTPLFPGIGGYADLLSHALSRLCGELPEDELAQLRSRAALVRLRVGDTLYRQGEPGDCLHVVLTGRLQVKVADSGGHERIVAHTQPGDVIGEIALFSGAGRAATIVASRDATLAAIARHDIDTLIARHPEVFSNIARMIIARLTGRSDHISERSGARILMIAPLHHSVDVQEFCWQLRHALLRYGSVLQLDAQAARQRFGYPEEGNYGRLLDECEKAHDFLLLVAEPVPGAWNHLCLGYADKIVLLADSEQEPTPTELERWLTGESKAPNHPAETLLVLNHRIATCIARTAAWLAARKFACHYHVRRGNAADIARVARFLSGNAVALVLAGGGARGFAHLGVIRALQEAGVTIDAVGGASFGALAATGLARGLDAAETFAEQREAFTCDDPLGDYTLPVMSLVRGEHLGRILRRHLPMDIEDLWLPFFAVSSDLSTNRICVHDRGPLWQAIRASVSLPAILPPVLENGHLLVDGGVLNNLPIDVMRARMSGPIIAVDLAVDALWPDGPAALPGNLEYLKSRLLPWRRPLEAPTLSRVILQVTTLASRKEVQNARQLAELYLNPPLEKFDFLDWSKMEEIAEAGYRHALPRIEEWLTQHPQWQSRASFIDDWWRSRAA